MKQLVCLTQQQLEQCLGRSNVSRPAIVLHCCCRYEPTHCTLRRPTAAQARQCLHRKRLAYVGDSIMRWVILWNIHCILSKLLRAQLEHLNVP